MLSGVACWGLLAFMLYQARTFHDPFAFAKAQMVWGERSPVAGIGHKAIELITFEPMRATYSQESACYWKNRKPYGDAALNLQFANPILFLLMLFLLALGLFYNWIDVYEAVLGSLLLLIPYVVQTSRQCMTSQGRFAAVVWPGYLVLGHIFSRLPTGVAVYILCMSGLLMLMYAAMFSCGFPLM
jgi:hypothetical protein